jgi:hypothetical protein
MGEGLGGPVTAAISAMADRPMTAGTLTIFIIFAIALIAFMAIGIPSLKRVRRRAQQASPTMTMRFSVGAPPQQVDIEYTQQTQTLVARVDGEERLKRALSQGFNREDSVEFDVGVNVKHKVRMAVERQRLYGGVSPQQFTATVDGQVVAHGQSTLPRRSP